MRANRTEDAELLVAAAAGDDRAFDAFYERHLPAVVGFFLRRTGRRDVALDLTAETFAAVVVALGRYDPARGPGAPWLFGIAANKLRESARRRRVDAAAREALHHEPLAFDDSDLERVEELASLSSELDLERLLAALPPAEREAICARVLDERPYGEIAAELAISQAPA